MWKLAVQRGGYSSPSLSNPFPNLCPQTPKEKSCIGRVREASGVLVHSLASADAPNFNLSLIQTTFLVRSRQKLSHANQAWQHNDPNQCELKASGRKHFSWKRRKILIKRSEGTFQVLNRPKRLRYHFDIHLWEINTFGHPGTPRGFPHLAATSSSSLFCGWVGGLLLSDHFLLYLQTNQHLLLPSVCTAIKSNKHARVINVLTTYYNPQIINHKS